MRPRSRHLALPSRALVQRVLRNGLLHSTFQPIYSLHDLRLVAVEALTRFEVPPGDSPTTWFDAAHRCGLGNELELMAVEHALEQVRDLPRDVQVCVNVSPATAVDRRLERLVRRRPGQLAIELTEHEVVHDYDALILGLAPLRAAGVGVSVDDAGAGFASLRHIVRLAPEVVKLDISLTQHLEGSQVLTALAAAVVDFVHGIGATLVVEGIEHASDLRIWSDLGADAAQGHLLGRPGPLPALPFALSHHSNSSSPFTSSCATDGLDIR